jgi:microcystin degradation protein MlrC
MQQNANVGFKIFMERPPVRISDYPRNPRFLDTLQQVIIGTSGPDSIQHPASSNEQRASSLMRILSAGIVHETNTFATTPTTLENFVQDSGGDPALPAESIARRFRGTGTIHGGYFEGAKAHGATLVPLYHVYATPGGTVEQAAYEAMKAELLARLQRALPADGVLLDLHGAMVTQQHEDAEGDLAAAVRRALAPSVPIIMTLDLHANVTQQMADSVNAIIGFDTYPHCDMRERGREAFDLLVRTVRGEVRPRMAFHQLPLVTMPPLQCTLREPMQSILQQLHALEAQPGVLTATLACGFPFADIRDAGTSVIVVTDGDRPLAEELARKFGDYVFSRRAEFTPKLTAVQEAIRYTREVANGLVVLADGSDNPGGGAPCDGTVILRELINADMQDAVVGVLADPETVAQAHAAGVGQTIHARIGGKTDGQHGEPVEADAYVRILGDGVFTFFGPMGRGVRGELGRMAVLVIGGVEVVLAERRNQLRDLEMLRCVGIEPTRRRLIAVKSAVHFRADFGPIAETIFDADTPGVHRPDFSKFEYKKLRRPVYPLDDL